MTILCPGDPRFPWLPKRPHQGLKILLIEDHPFLPDGFDFRLSRRIDRNVWTFSQQLSFAEIRSCRVPARVLVARTLLTLRHHFHSELSR